METSNKVKMDVFTLKRWSALIDGVNLILDSAGKHGVSEYNVSIKQTHLIKYIDESTERVRVF